jgi:hypothetical protein
MTHKMKYLLSTITAPLLLAAFTAHAADPLPPGVTLLDPSAIPWTKLAGGREGACVLGDPTKAGAYLCFVKWPPHNKALAHVHPENRYGIVVSGVHYIGYGDKFDEKKLTAHPAGTYFTEPANTPHFGMTKGEGAVLYFYAIGPSGTKALE